MRSDRLLKFIVDEFVDRISDTGTWRIRLHSYVASSFDAAVAGDETWAAHAAQECDFKGYSPSVFDATAWGPLIEDAFGWYRDSPIHSFVYDSGDTSPETYPTANSACLTWEIGGTEYVVDVFEVTGTPTLNSDGDVLDIRYRFKEKNCPDE